MVFADVADVIERRFESHIINVRPDYARYRSLTDTQLQIIRTQIRPGAAENPFPERLQLRNWLMIELLLETSIRRGELLKLYTRISTRVPSMPMSASMTANMIQATRALKSLC